MNDIESLLGYNFKDKKNYIEALTHSSVSQTKNYEKLEFIGDSIINYFATIWLLKRFPEDNESTLSIKKSQLVNQTNLSFLSKSLKLYKFLKINKNIPISERLHCDIFESIIGGIYIDSNIEKVTKVLDSIFAKNIKLNTLKNQFDYKGLMISLYKKNLIKNLNISTFFDKKSGSFISQLSFNNLIFYGFAKNKKNAEKRSSKFAYKKLDY